MATTPHILIAGPGIAGLPTALALLRRGIDVDIYEVRTGAARARRRPAASANGSRVLTHLGLALIMEQIVCPAAGKEVRLWDNGSALEAVRPR